MVERESTKHGGRVDDQLAHETASVVQGSPVPGQSRGDRRQEDPAEGLGAGELRPEVPGRAAVGDEEATARAELARVVAPARFPAERGELLEAAAASGAGDRVLEELRALPGGVAFDNVQAIWDALGGHHEDRPGRRERRAG